MPPTTKMMFLLMTTSTTRWQRRRRRWWLLLCYCSCCCRSLLWGQAGTWTFRLAKKRGLLIFSLLDIFSKDSWIILHFQVISHSSSSICLFSIICHAQNCLVLRSVYYFCVVNYKLRSFFFGGITFCAFLLLCTIFFLLLLLAGWRFFWATQKNFVTCNFFFRFLYLLFFHTVFFASFFGYKETYVRPTNRPTHTNSARQQKHQHEAVVAAEERDNGSRQTKKPALRQKTNECERGDAGTWRRRCSEWGGVGDGWTIVKEEAAANKIKKNGRAPKIYTWFDFCK